MAEFTKAYKAKGVLSTAEGTLTETKKEGILTHDFMDAFRKFEGQDVSISITLKEEIEPIDSEASGE